MTGRVPLLYFASVYWDDPFITPQQIALQLARRYDVLYVEPSPSFIYIRDVARNRRWLRVGLPPRRVADGLHVYSPPPMLPLKTRFPRVNTISQRWVRPFVANAARSLALERPVLFTFLPHLHAVVGAYGERAVCYYCIDDMGALTRVIDPQVVGAYERRLIAQADLVFTTSRMLKARFEPLHPEVHLVPNGSDPDLYGRALDAATTVAPEIARLRKPVLGFAGLIDFRLDQALVAEVARRRPDWSFAFVGPIRTSVAALAALPNVHFVREQPLAVLPSFLKGFTVALIPYTIGQMVRAIYPTKLNDYLGAGLPVITTPLPELSDCPPELVAQVESASRLVEAAERLASGRDDVAAVRQRLAFARANSWEARASVIAARLDEHLARRAACAS